MRGRQARLAIGVVGTIVGLAAEWVALENGADPSGVVLNLAIGLAYVYGGLAIWAYAPSNRTGAKMTAVGLTWFIPGFAGAPIPLLGDLGIALYDVYAAFLLALVLAYPGGRLETTVDKVGVGVMLVGTIGIEVVVNMVPVPLVLNQGTNGLYGGLALGIMASGLVLRRWWLAAPSARRDLAPVLVAGGVFIVTIVVNLVRRIAEVPDTTAQVLVAIVHLAPAAVPVALLVGFFRQSERRLQALVDAIPDPLFRVDRDGTVLDVVAASGSADGPRPPHLRGPQLRDLLFGDGHVDTAIAATRALEEDHLQSLDVRLELPDGPRELEVRLAPSGPSEVTAIVRDFTDQRRAEAEVRASRARIVEAADAERRRVERNLHDGAQQRLVALSLALRRAQAQLGPEQDGSAAVTLREANDQLRVALADLRELARGIHPAILTEAGLGPALRSLAAESPVPVALELDLPDDLSSHVEAAAYFMVAEALTNVAKYAEANRVTVTAHGGGGELRVEVTDDGRGGADPASGSGLRGLDDRVAALGGRLEVRSPTGQGTRVIATLPIGLAATNQ
jgi:signal transduction histidine kinase